MTLHDICQVTCKSFQTSLVWSLFLHLILSHWPWAACALKNNLACLYQVTCTEPLYSHYNCEHAVLIYNAKIVLVINGKDVSSYRFPLPPWHFMWYCFVLQLNCLEIRISGAIFNCVFYVSVHADPVDGLACQQPCLFTANVIHVQLVLHLALEWCWHYYSFYLSW